MPSKTRNSIRQKKTSLHLEGESALEDGWPPSWSVSFADLTTLLMSGFILWYALTAMRIPPELLSIKTVDQVLPAADFKTARDLTKKEDTQSMIMLKIKALTPKQRKVVRDLKNLRELKENLEEYIQTEGLEEVVEVEVGLDAVLVTPKEPMLFSGGSAALKQSSFGLLDKIIETLLTQPFYRIRIEGHTDDTPLGHFRKLTFPSNWELSYARAISVAEYFIGKGIPPETIGVSGYGEHKPKYPNTTPENKAKNRRVDIYISLEKPKDKDTFFR